MSMINASTHPSKRKVNEQAIQRLFARLAKQNALLAAIQGTEAVRQAATALRGPHVIPALSIDSLQRERIILAADEALNALGDVEIISDNTSISRNPGEILRPDFVLFNRKLGRLILVELKDDKQPERQAVTELLAYERELRNHFPFMGGMDVVFVLIAREWGDLLNHAYAALAARGRPSLLALTVSGEEPDLAFTVRTDQAWYRHFQVHIAPAALRSRTYRVQFKDVDPEASWLALREAGDLMRQAADRAGQHGFSCIWENGYNSNEVGIIIYAVDPAHLHIPVDPVNPTRDSDFASFFSNFFSTNEMRFEPGLEAILLPWRQALRNRATIEHLRDGTWHDDMTWLEDHGNIVTGYQYWGMVADFAGQIGTSAAAREHFHLDQSVGVGSPVVGLQIITAMTGSQPFFGGRIGARSLFEVGVLLQSAMTLAQQGSIDQAKWIWVNCKLAVYNAELADLARSWVDPSGPMEPLYLFAEPTAETAENIRQFGDWLLKELDESPLSGIFRAAFNAGFTPSLSPTCSAEAYWQVCLDLCASIDQHQDSRDKWATAITSLPEWLQSCETAFALFERMSATVDAKQCMPILVDLSDAWIPPLRRRQVLAHNVAFDVEDLRHGIDDMLRNLPEGQLPCILIGADGGVGSSIIDQPETMAPLDYTQQVAVLNRASGRDLLIVLDWSELADGTLKALRSNIDGKIIELHEWGYGSFNSLRRIDNHWLGEKIDFSDDGLYHPGTAGARFLEVKHSKDIAPELAIVINTTQPLDRTVTPYYEMNPGAFTYKGVWLGYIIVDVALDGSFERHTLLFDICDPASQNALSHMRAQAHIHFLHCDPSGNVVAFREIKNTFSLDNIIELALQICPGTAQGNARRILCDNKADAQEHLESGLAANSAQIK
ncbi:hypothetical protein [Komagataeibacter diospyri]|uniref:Uncharacterized protein n=1 Tax=Komagataeibacter diospyri TaxID=1932662 RepID=A0A4P5NUC2_9PROT|nr:hypothetical protein [Komagataeibacter diospyri]GCE85243.1 hypothetical protein MSKU9_3384 [Komagataeibacter diospyri]